LREAEPPESPLRKITENSPYKTSPPAHDDEDEDDDCVVTFKPLNAEERDLVQLAEEKYAKLKKEYVCISLYVSKIVITCIGYAG